MTRAALAVFLLIITAGCATVKTTSVSPTIDELQSRFEEGVIALATDKDVSYQEVHDRVAELAQEIYGEHPLVLKAEAERRFAALPEFKVASLWDYAEVENVTEFPSMEYSGLLLAFGWDPSGVARGAKMQLLGRNTSSLAKMAVLSQFCPDRFYRLPGGDSNQVVVESFGDLFFVEMSMTDEGFFRPVSVKWMKRKPKKSADPDPESGEAGSPSRKASENRGR